MLIVFGTAGLALAALLFGVVLIGSRKPHPPLWAGEFMVANVHGPVIIALMVVGFGLYIKYVLTFSDQSLTLVDIALAAGIAAACLLTLKALQISRRLAEYEREQSNAEIVKPAAFFKDAGHEDQPDPPVKTTSGRMAA